jgi:hypothetical protein
MSIIIRAPRFARSASSCAPQHNVKRPISAIPRLRGGDRQQMRAKLRLVEPTRHRTFQHAGANAPPAGNHQDTTLAAGARCADERTERSVRLSLGHPVQIEPSLDRVLAAFQALGIRAVDARETVERQRRRR